MLELFRLLVFIILTITLVGCSNNNINHKIYQDGEKYVNQMYQIKSNINSTDLDIEGLQIFLEQDKSELTPEEKQFIGLINDFFIQYTQYIADKKADGVLDKTTEENFMNIADKLKNEYGISLKEQ